MKKLLVLPALGAAAALTYGAAAALTVNDTATLQVGITGSLSCADSADVVAWGYRDDITPGGVAYATVKLNGAEDCVGNWLHVTPLDGSNVQLPMLPINGGAGVNSAGRVEIVAGEDTYTVRFGYTPVSPAGPEYYVNASQLERARIAIDQGW